MYRDFLANLVDGSLRNVDRQSLKQSIPIPKYLVDSLLNYTENAIRIKVSELTEESAEKLVRGFYAELDKHRELLKIDNESTSQETDATASEAIT